MKKTSKLKALATTIYVVSFITIIIVANKWGRVLHLPHYKSYQIGLDSKSSDSVPVESSTNKKGKMFYDNISLTCNLTPEISLRLGYTGNKGLYVLKLKERGNNQYYRYIELVKSSRIDQGYILQEYQSRLNYDIKINYQIVSSSILKFKLMTAKNMINEDVYTTQSHEWIYCDTK